MRRTRNLIISALLLLAPVSILTPLNPSAHAANAVPAVHAAAKKGGATPALAAKAFYRAWRSHNRSAAAKVATPGAVKKLFRTRASGPGWLYQGCTEKSKPDPHFDCAYSYEGGATIMQVADSDAFGWFVTKVTFIAD
jgi:hypothetical protein